MSEPSVQPAGAQADRHAPFGQLSFRDDGTIAHANGQLHEWVGATPGSLIDRSVNGILAPASRIFHSTHFFPLLKLHQKADEIHLVLRHASGADVPVLVSAVRRTSGDETLNHCALMVVSQRKEFEARLLEARQAAETATAAKDHFLAVVSHELRNPLSAIMGWVRLMQSGKLDGPMTQRAIDTIERNAKAQSVLIEDLLDVSRIISGKLRLSPRAVDLAPLVDMALDTGKPAARAKDIDLVVTLDRSAGIVHADPQRVQQIVWNLVSNAVKFTPKGGRVQVTLARIDSRVRIAVSDTGEGILPAQLPYVFDRFWQSPGQQRERQGLGLGLSICKSLVELHGGTLQAHSEGPGKGAVFTVDFPLAVAASPSVVTAATLDDRFTTDSEALAGMDVLVVDDDPDARGLMKMLLEAASAKVTLAASTDEALGMLETFTPHVLVSDVGMPGKDGFELIGLVRSGAAPRSRQVPAVAVTGLSRPQDRIRLLRAGFQAHLTKPVEPSEAVALVQALARRD